VRIQNYQGLVRPVSLMQVRVQRLSKLLKLRFFVQRAVSTGNFCRVAWQAFLPKTCVTLLRS